jgi:MFS family permease
MNNRKKHISPLLFYFLVSSLSAIVDAGLGFLLLLLLVDWREKTGLIYAFGYFLFYSLLIGIIIRSLSSFSEKSQLIKVVGMMPARLVGFFTGSILGLEFADTIGAIIGGILFYFLGRWLGPILSSRISDSIENIFHVDAVPPIEDRKIFPIKRALSIIYFLVLPILFLLVALLLQHYGALGDNNFQYLNVAKTVAFVISIITISIPYFLKSVVIQGFTDRKSSIINQDLTMYFLGIAFSTIPTILGFVLFIYGGSIYEMGLYIFLSVLAGTVWTISQLDKSKLGG